MKKHEVIMKMHNDNGVLYRTLYEKNPFYYKRRIFIPTTGLNNIQRPVEDIIAERIEEFIDDVKEEVRNTVEDIAKVRDRLEAAISENIERDKQLFHEAAKETIQELTTIALDKLFDI